MSKKKPTNPNLNPEPTTSPMIPTPRVCLVAVEIAGTADLLQNNFSQKSIEQMLRKHMGFPVQKEAKKPREVIEQATIRNVVGAVCIPPAGIKAAMLTASTHLKTFKKTQLRTSLFVAGNSIPITYDRMEPLMSMVRTSGMSRTPDVRFRPSFIDWKARLVVHFSDQLQPQTVVDLVQRAGTVGVGEWRPEKNGTYGTFEVRRIITDAAEVKEVEQLCSPQMVRPRIPEWALDVAIDPAMLKRVFEEQDVEDEEAPPAKRGTNGALA